MTSQQLADLEAKIQEWADTESEEGNLDLYWGNDTTRLMARAAACVVEACIESQREKERNG